MLGFGVAMVVDPGSIGGRVDHFGAANVQYNVGRGQLLAKCSAGKQGPRKSRRRALEHNETRTGHIGPQTLVRMDRLARRGLHRLTASQLGIGRSRRQAEGLGPLHIKFAAYVGQPHAQHVGPF